MAQTIQIGPIEFFFSGGDEILTTVGENEFGRVAIEDPKQWQEFVDAARSGDITLGGDLVRPVAERAPQDAGQARKFFGDFYDG